MTDGSPSTAHAGRSACARQAGRAGGSDDSLRDRYARVRAFSERLCAPLETEDYVVQSMPEASPPRWHLAHVTWFFETFVLARAAKHYQPFNPQFAYLFNSYYNAAGPQFPRPQRGLLTRPTVAEVYAYRHGVDERMGALLADFDPDADPELALVIETGLHHEQQHQELLLTDLKHMFSCNPLHPVYRERAAEAPVGVGEHEWIGFEEGMREIGHRGAGFHYDNEAPRHRVFVGAFRLASRPVTCGEYLEFVQDGGYERPDHWLAAGWDFVQNERWSAPLYWLRRDDQWRQYTLAGERPLHAEEPVTHVSYFEADAYARWAGARLPTEAEWEVAAETVAVSGNFADGERFHPAPAAAMNAARAATLQQMFGDVWEWTSSAYSAYPGYRPPAGALGEYNGKFMCNQYVLRGGSCVSSANHLRRTYRNFWAPGTRFQFTGLRLAK